MPGTLLVGDGDAIVIDILENPKTNGKIQDFIKVTREKRRSGYFLDLAEPKNFSLSDVSFQLTDFKVFFKDKPLEEKTRSLNSAFVSFYIKEIGTFIFSPFENEKYSLAKIGFIENEKIVFKHKGSAFRIVSAGLVLGAPGKWNLWGKFIPETEKQKQEGAEGQRVWNSMGRTGKVPIRFVTKSRKNLASFFEPSTNPPKRRRNVLSFDN